MLSIYSEYLKISVIINDEENDIANKSVMTSLKMLKKMYSNHVGEVNVVQINASDTESTVNRLCQTWNSSLGRGTLSLKIPDLVIDTTKFGMATETVQTFTSTLGIPTVSGVFGQKGDLP